MMVESKERIARRLSGALGRSVSPDVVKVIGDNGPGAYLVDVDGDVVTLCEGNTVLLPGGEHLRNGKRLSEAEVHRLYSG